MEQCEDCKQKKPDVHTRECPYVKELYDRTDMVTICDACYKERLYDI